MVVCKGVVTNYGEGGYKTGRGGGHVKFYPYKKCGGGGGGGRWYQITLDLDFGRP